MDIKDVNINNIKDLSEEDLAKVRRQGMRNFASFVLLKVFLFAVIGALGKTLARRAEMQK